jgi:anti-anti-sigma regulatory factor
MKALKIERAPGEDRFRFVLEGTIDPHGARALDRVLFECQARGASAVFLDFTNVRSICTLGTSVLARQGRVYEETERKICVVGLSPEIRKALEDVEAIVYEPNEPPPGSDPYARPSLAQPSPEPTTPTEPPTAPETSELAALQSKLKRKLVEFRNLFEITRALNLAPDLEEVLNLFGLSVMGQFGVERLAVLLPDPARGQALVPKHVRGFAQDHFREFGVAPESFQGGPMDPIVVPLEELRDATEGLEALRASGFVWSVALRIRQELEGIALLGGRGSGRDFDEDERDLLSTLARQAAVAIANARHRRAQEERDLGLVRAMMSLIESRDPYARGTTERVVRYVTATAKLLQVPKASLKSLIYGALLRDIGMITISQLIFKNPAHLSEQEWALLKQHPERGAQILEEMDFPPEVLGIVRHHHERWGGGGYPAGLRGTEIPLGARIVALVDSYVAMTAERPYRRALPHEKAKQVLAENWGAPFDPRVVEVFLEVLDKVERRSRQRLRSLKPSESSPAEPAPLPLENRP